MSTTIAIPSTASTSRNIFDEAKNYRELRFQQGRYLLDSELNELQDILYDYIGGWLRDVYGNSFIDTGYLIAQSTITSVNNFSITMGEGYVDGVKGYLAASLDYVSQAWVSSATLSSQAYITQLLWNDAGSVPALTTPGTLGRNDLVVLSLIPQEINCCLDTIILDPNLTEETSRRWKYISGVTVFEGFGSYPVTTGYLASFSYDNSLCVRTPIAWISRPASTAQITTSQILDIRDSTSILKIKASLEAYFDTMYPNYGAATKATPVDADTFGFFDSVVSNIPKNATWADIKSVLKTYFDIYYPNSGSSAKATPIDADSVDIIDSADSSKPKLTTWANIKSVLKTYFDTYYGAGSPDGWIPISVACSYASTDSPIFVMNMSSDMTTVLSEGMKMKLTQSTVENFFVHVVGSYAGGSTPITLYGGTDYALVDSTISSVYYSSQKAPFGFSLDPTIWQVLVSSTTVVTVVVGQGNLATIGNISISVPIGKWKGRTESFVYGSVGGNTARLVTTLSTLTFGSTPGEQFIDSSSYVAGYEEPQGDLIKSFYLSVTSKTKYYFLVGLVGSTATLSLRGNIRPVKVVVECAYL